MSTNKITISQYQRTMNGIIATLTAGEENQTYKTIATQIDNILIYSYGKRILFDNADDTTNMIKTYLLSNNYKWKTLIASTEFKYNPIQNYNGDEEENTTLNRTGSDTRTYIENLGKRTDVQTSDIYPYNKNTPTPSNSLTSENGEQINDTTDNNQYGSKFETIRKYHREGNLGVTSTQNMIKQEREIADINISKDIAHDIANLISYGIYDRYHDCVGTTSEEGWY